MVYIRTYEHLKADWVWKDSWVDDMASSMLDKWGGNCFRYASLLGLMIHEATGLTVDVNHGWWGGPHMPHGYVTVLQDGVWYLYDVEVEKHSPDAVGSYRKITYSKVNYTYWYYAEGKYRLE